MKWLITALLIISAAGSCDPLQADTSKWSDKERQLWHSYLALSAIDTMQTMKMIDCQKKPHCPIIERNPLLGERPKKGELLALKVVGNVVIYNMLEHTTDDRLKALRWLTAVQGLVVTHNGIYYIRRF